MFLVLSPSNGDPTVSTLPTLTWDAAPGATSYDLELANDPHFPVLAYHKEGIQETSFTLERPIQPGPVYYWRVTAVGPDGGRTVASNAPRALASPVSAGPSPHGIAVTPSNDQALITNDVSPGSVTLLDLQTFSKQSIALPGRPGMVVVAPDGRRAYVAESSPNDIAVIDLASRTVVATIKPPCPTTTLRGLAISDSGDRLVVPDLDASCMFGVLDVIPLPGTQIQRAIPLGTFDTGFGVALGGDRSSWAIVTEGFLPSLETIDLTTDSVANVPWVGAAFGVTVAGFEALVATGASEGIKRLEFAHRAPTGTIDFKTNQDVGSLANDNLLVAVGDTTTALIYLPGPTVVATYQLAGRSVALTRDKRALVTGAGEAGQVYVIGLP
jgi:YVTN family beta-propeller protein